MKLRAVGRQMVVKMDFDLIDQVNEKSTIQWPQEVIDRLKGGCQIYTVLDVGASAFDDEPPEVRETIVPGRQVLTARYPGHSIDLNPMSSDAEVAATRIIVCDEVHALVALEGEEGADV